MHISRKYYIASCLFTARFPRLSQKIQTYIRAKGGIEIIRCCIPNYRTEQNAERIEETAVRAEWENLPVSEVFETEDTVYSACPNCTNIVEEWRGATAISLWELIDGDPAFPFPDYGGVTMTVQDCWRTRDRGSEQAAARSLLEKMNIRYIETKHHHADTDFCGCTLYRPQPAKNEKLAPEHYVRQAQGKFLPHAPDEQETLMREYCAALPTRKVVCYCHYCLEGLLLGGADARQIAQLLFP